MGTRNRRARRAKRKAAGNAPQAISRLVLGRKRKRNHQPSRTSQGGRAKRGKV